MVMRGARINEGKGEEVKGQRRMSDEKFAKEKAHLCEIGFLRGQRGQTMWQEEKKKNETAHNDPPGGKNKMGDGVFVPPISLSDHAHQDLSTTYIHSHTHTHIHTQDEPRGESRRRIPGESRVEYRRPTTETTNKKRGERSVTARSTLIPPWASGAGTPCSPPNSPCLAIKQSNSRNNRLCL